MAGSDAGAPPRTEDAHESAALETVVDSQADARSQRQSELRLERGMEVGRYVVLDKVGAGAMGVVYAAYDPELDRKIALKLLRAGRLDGRERSRGAARLLREAQAMARIGHPNVITVHDVGTVGDDVFVAMEFVEGMTLTRWLAVEDRPWRDVLDVFVRAGRGLAAAHASNLIHRDFKPENVLIGDDGRVRVVDFGLARGADDSTGQTHAGTPVEVERSGSGSLSATLTRTGALVGTPAYMSPEQHVGAPADVRSDQFAFCVALYEGLFGQRPFSGKTQAALAYQVTQGKIREPPKGLGIPGHLRRAVLRGLSVDTDLRYPGMDGLLADLQRDPAATRRRVMFVAGAAALVIGGAYAQRRATAMDRAVCAGAPEHVAPVWNDERRAAGRDAFVAIDRAYAADTWTRVEHGIDDYLGSWTTMYVDACEATRVRGEQSSELLDLRMACLSRRLAQVDALVEVFEHADADVVERAVMAMDDLPGVAECGDTPALLAPIRPPKDDATRQSVDDVRRRIAAAAASRSGGRYEPALTAAREAVELARATSYRPVEAEALLELGHVEAYAGEAKLSEQHLLEAVWAAEAGRHDHVAIDAWMRMVSVVGQELERHDDGHRAAQHAEALLERIGGDPVRAAELAGHVGSVLVAEGDYQRALEHHQRAFELRSAELGPDDPRVGASLSNVGTVHRLLGNYEDSHETHTRALEVRERALGPDHPEVAKSLTNLANVLQILGKNDEALELQRRSVALMRRALPADHPHLAKAVGNLGNVYWALGQHDEAVSRHRMAAEMTGRSLGPEHPGVAHWLDNAGVVLGSQGKHTEALKTHQRALAILERAFDGDHPSIGFCLSNIGDSLDRLDRSKEAVPILDRALGVLERTVGEDHPDLAPVLVNLGNVLQAIGKHRESIPYFERARVLDEAALGPDNVNVAYDLYGIARAHVELGNPADAVDLARRALELREHGDSPPEELAETRFLLARALWATDRPARGRAHALATQAATDLQGLGDHHKAALAPVWRWLASHRPPGR